MRASSSCSSSYSNNSSHIIDPSYSRSTSAQLYVYVDDSGAHDPDYRHFPLVNRAPKIITTSDDDSIEFDPIELRRVHSHNTQHRRSSVSPPPSSPRYSCSSLDESRPSSSSRRNHLVRISHPPISSFLDIDDDALEAEEEEDNQTPSETRPRSPSLKMRWHALMLGLQLGAFRASKHMRRRSSASG